MTLNEILKQIDQYRQGRVPQADLDFFKRYFDVDESLRLTSKYKDLDVLTTDKTIVYRNIVDGKLADAYNFIGTPNQPLGRIYGVVHVLGLGNFAMLDAIKQGKIRIIPLGMLRAKPENTPYVPPAPIPSGPTQDTTITPPSGGGGMDNKTIMMVAGAALVLLLLMKK
jgi:hypothetical protein